jgi:CCR4-NOT transcription complex subunit 9
MQTEIVPLCLRIMKNGQALSKTVATFIIQKILGDEKGLNYICTTLERFYAVSIVLNSMLKELIDNNKEDHRLSKHIMKCYCRLSENGNACSHLNKNLPEFLKSPPPNLLDEEGKKCYHTFMKNLNESNSSAMGY